MATNHNNNRLVGETVRNSKKFPEKIPQFQMDNVQG